MNIFWEELTAGIPETRQLVQVIIRLFAAVTLGAIIGLQRERVGKPAGFRTHILVMLGTTVFTLSGSIYGMTTEGISRVLQGIITGIGFIGAGSILKQRDELKIRGLTTAAGIWMTTAVGAAVGLGFLGLAIIATGLLLLILKLSDPLENDSKKYGKSPANEEQKQ
ncbi:MAG: MgtC/SapB family protein [Pyrinomonadaceae bacterium]|nr:MgtC/SapB family protein [Pyrinomonadaceae bacterium]